MMTLLAVDNLIFGMTPAQVALLGSMLVIILTVNHWRKNVIRKRAQASRSAPAETRPTLPTGTGATSMRDVTTQVQALLGEVEETARRAAAQIDNRYRKLEQLVAEADEKIAKLESLRDQQGGTAEGRAAEALAGQLRESTRAATTRVEAARVETNTATDPVYQLADAGMGAKEIAQRLGKQPGEIELILALRGGQRR